MKQYIASSIGKKQIVAITGLGMVFFLVAHLLGNLLIFSGPEAYNAYAKTLESLGPLLWVARLGLLASVVLHFTFITLLILQNKNARPQEYDVPLHEKTRSLFARTMRYSGVIILVYIIIHLLDYTFTEHTVSNASINGEYFGLFGHVYNSFLNPLRTLFYVLTMISLSFHLVHGVQSVTQTFGLYHAVYTPLIRKLALVIACILGVGFSSIPIYILLFNPLYGGM
jgi:succinate dehydrogenase / fumarate reductase cytochrome b subunit